MPTKTRPTPAPGRGTPTMTEGGEFTRIEADRILRRAATLEGSPDALRVSAEELRAIAREAGFAPQAVERAMEEVRESNDAPPAAPPVQKWGLFVMNRATLRQIPVEIDSDQLMRAVRLLQPYREGPARLSLEEGEVAWRDRRGLRFTVTTRPGLTEIRVHVSKLALRRRRWTRWVKAAADRLEELVVLVAERDQAAEPPGRLESGDAPTS